MREPHTALSERAFLKGAPLHLLKADVLAELGLPALGAVAGCGCTLLQCGAAEEPLVDVPVAARRQ
jgi:hypothetical protein